MKKIILGAFIAALSSSAFAGSADNLEVKLHGKFDFQAGHRNQKKIEGDEKFLTKNRKDNSFYTKAAMSAEVSNTTDCGIKYGANIVLQTTTKSSGLSNQGSYLFTESDYGRLEAGSTYSAMAKMAVSGYDISSATGDGFLAYAGNVLENDYYMGKAESYDPVFAGIALDTSSEELRVLSYYTPKMHGVQLGVSYMPDGTSFGNTSMKNKSVQTTELFDKSGNTVKAKLGVKDVVSVGMTFEHNITDGVDLKVGAGYVQATNSSKLVDSEDESKETGKLKLDDYKLYNFGAVLSYGNWMVGGSYADAGKSMTNSTYHFTKRQNKFYTAAVGYNNGPIGVSLTYLRNDKFKNKLDSYTLGTDFKLAPGFKPYAEVTSFKYKNKGFKKVDDVMKQDNKKQDGMVYIIGTRLQF